FWLLRRAQPVLRRARSVVWCLWFPSGSCAARTIVAVVPVFVL
ncbi:hypothetical protein A2U01_0084287, partial [Trifolium medium]|nr:hypothetical protein [Trifolium medium]